MNFNKPFLKSSIIVAAILSSSAALATQAGDILVRARLININPDASSDVPGLDVEPHYSLDVDFTYMVNANFGVELLLDTSASHRITVDGNDIASVRVLPPSLIAQYHFLPTSNLRPYVGAGINYTLFFDEELVGGGSIKLDDSVGLVAQAGVDYDINNDWFINADIKYIDMNTDTTINGVAGPDVDINPTILGIGIGKRF